MIDKSRHKKIFLPAGRLSRIVVLGNGGMTVSIAQFARQHEIECYAFTGPRQAQTRLPDGDLIADRLAALGVELRIVEDIRACGNGPYQLAHDNAALFSIGSPYIIRRDLLDLYGGRVINSHGAPLPEWRGGGGFSWRILAGDRRGAACFHLVSEKIDGGDIVYLESYEFPATLRYPRDYAAFAAERNEVCLVDLLQGLLDGKAFEVVPQDPSRATYFPRLHTASQAWIDWTWPGPDIERFVCAFSHPYDGAKTFVNNGTVSIFDCFFEQNQMHPHPFFFGIVFQVHDERHYIACNGGSLIIDRSHLDTERPLKAGDRLFTPRRLLEEALAFRPIFTPTGLKGR